VRKVAPDGRISTVAGNGEPGISGDGGSATEASILAPIALMVDTQDRLYICDQQRVRRVETYGTIQSVIGTGSSGNSGDGGPATEA